MALSKYEDLTDIHLDVLKEVGNIGSGNAAAALSTLINKNVQIQMPNISIVPFQEATNLSGGAERVVAGVMSRMVGGIEGMILILMDKNFVNTIIKVFFNQEVHGLIDMDKTVVSALSEVGNIICGTYVSAIGQLTGIDVKLASPCFQVDMAGALMSVPVIEFGEVGDKILYIDKNLIIDGQTMNAEVFLIPTIDSLGTIMTKLGIEV